MQFHLSSYIMIYWFLNCRSYFLFFIIFKLNGTIWPYMYWCVVKKLLTHSPMTSSMWQHYAILLAVFNHLLVHRRGHMSTVMSGDWLLLYICISVYLAEKQLYEVHRQERQLELSDRRQLYQWSTTSTTVHHIRDESLLNVVLPRRIQVYYGYL